MATLFQFPYRTVAEVSLSALLKNVHTLRQFSRREIIPVIKADAYGHGLVPIARTLVTRGSCLTLAVATLEEATELRRRVPHGVQILVLSGFFPHQLEAYTKFRLIPVIHNLLHLKTLLGRKQLPELHLEFDTGMHRLGILPGELDEVIKTLEKLKVKLAGLSTHFAESETLTSPFTDEQIAVFSGIHAALKAGKYLHTDAKIHIANSGAILRGKLWESVAVRPGIALFGVTPNPRLPGSEELVPVLRWKTRILAIKEIKKGETVGYNRTYEAKKKEKLAILPVGYADGYARTMSNKAEVLVAGKRAPVRGIISMDLTTIDVSHIPGVKEGMEVLLLGKAAKDEVTAAELGIWAGTISYEILAGISARVPRVYFDD